MEPAFALLLPLVGGYLFVTHCKLLKYKHAREDGHRLYFQIAYYGILLFVATSLVAAGTSWLLSLWTWSDAFRAWTIEAMTPLLKDRTTAAPQAAFFIICLGTVALGRLGAPLVNKLFVQETYDAIWKAAENDDLEELLLEAVAQLKPVSITLTSSKVYVGLVLQTPEPRTTRRTIALLPLMSGFRTDTGKLQFTTYYDQIYQERETDDDESNDFKLVLPLDKMLSVAFFDVAIYERFNVVTTRWRRVKVHGPAKTAGR